MKTSNKLYWILGAVCAQGTTVIRGGSREPEVTWLCRFLNQAGGKIGGIGTSCLTIQGVPRLQDMPQVLMCAPALLPEEKEYFWNLP